MTRANFVRSRRVRRANPARPGVTPWELAARLEEQPRSRWVRWAGHYGPLMGAWLPQCLRTPQRKLELLVSVVLALIVEEAGAEVGATWTLDLETDESGMPLRMIVSGAGSAVSTPITMQPSSIRIDGYEIALKSKDCGARILARLTDAICGALAVPTTTA